MAPDKIIKLDLKDKKICYQLELNARQSLGQIAKKVGLSKQVVSYRIKNLVGRGIIKGFYTILNTTNLGYMIFKIYIKVKDFDNAKEKSLVDWVRKDKRVMWFVASKGRWDYHLAVYAKHMMDYNDFYADFMEKWRDNISLKDFATVVEAYQFSRAYILSQKEDTSKYDIIFERKPSRWEGDKIDWEILKVIAPNGRAELKDIAKKAGISPKVVSYRLKKLEKMDVIQSYRAMFNIDLLGYKYYKVMLRLKNMTKQKEKELFTWLKYHPNIIYVTKSIAKEDYEFEVQSLGEEHFDKIVKEFRERFKDIVRTIEPLHYPYEYKFLYLPEATPE